MKVKPFLGRLVIEIIKEDTREYLNKKDVADGLISQEFASKIEIVRGENRVNPVTGQKYFEHLKAYKPTNRGKIVEMAPDCFGKHFQDRFENDREYPELGDIVMFLPNKSYQVDAENKYHIIDDCEIIGYTKAEDYIA